MYIFVNWLLGIGHRRFSSGIQGSPRHRRNRWLVQCHLLWFRRYLVELCSCSLGVWCNVHNVQDGSSARLGFILLDARWSICFTASVEELPPVGDIFSDLWLSDQVFCCSGIWREWGSRATFPGACVISSGGNSEREGRPQNNMTLLVAGHISVISFAVAVMNLIVMKWDAVKYQSDCLLSLYILYRFLLFTMFR